MFCCVMGWSEDRRHQNHVSAAIVQIPLKAAAHCQCLPGADLPGYVALDLCYISWLKLGSPAGQCAHALHHFPSRIIAERWQITVLPLYLPPLNSLDYGTWRILKPKGNATAQQKMGALKRTVWQLRAAKVGRCCGKIAVRSDCA
jgi:hypothetical protein